MQDLGTISTKDLLTHLAELVRMDNDLCADIVECLAQIDERQAHLGLGYPSLHVFCIERFGFSDDVAFRRIRAARVAQRRPEVIEMLRQGQISLSAVVRLAPHLDDVPDLLERAVGLSYREVEKLVASLRPDKNWSRDQSRLAPVGPGLYKLEVVLTQEQMDKLEDARALCRHRNPEGDLAELIEQGMELVAAQVEKEKFAVTDKPRSTGRATSERVTAAVRREVYRRDGGRCTFVGEGGRRCGSRAFIEYDHVVPEAAGGESTVENGRLLCEAHNKFEARRVLGQDRVKACIERAHTERGRARLIADVESGLRNLGFSTAQARSAARSAADSHPEVSSIEGLLRPALQQLAVR